MSTAVEMDIDAKIQAAQVKRPLEDAARPAKKRLKIPKRKYYMSFVAELEDDLASGDYDDEERAKKHGVSIMRRGHVTFTVEFSSRKQANDYHYDAMIFHDAVASLANQHPESQGRYWLGVNEVEPLGGDYDVPEKIDLRMDAKGNIVPVSQNLCVKVH